MDRSYTRKPHKKSRNGCIPCKGRHVKCDEQKPHCANCIKQGFDCTYRPLNSGDLSTASPVPVAASISTPLDAASPTPTLPVPGNETNLEPSLNITQLRILHHYTTVTAKTLAHEPESEVVFSVNLVQTAFGYPFLLHAVLALGALHLSRLENAHSSSRAEYSVLADRHHDAALNIFRATVTDIDHTNWKAVLLFAGALFPYSCSASVCTGGSLEYAFDNFLSNLALTRRVRPMVTSFYDEMINSELGRMISNDVKGVDWAAPKSPAKTELIDLRKFSNAIHHLYPSDIAAAYGHAIRLLELSFAVAAASPLPPSDALLKIWIHLVSDRYIELLFERQPGALIILAHYAVFLRRSERYWYLDGVAEQILNITNALVPSEFKSWLKWPNVQIYGQPAVAGSS